MPYVYSPFTSSVWNLDCYCNPVNGGCGACGQYGLHCAISGWGAPVDIGASPNAQIWCYMDSTIQSVSLSIHQSNFCNCGNSDYNNYVVVDLWSGQGAGGSHLGSVLYLHVSGPQSGTWNAPNPIYGESFWQALIGNVPGGQTCNPCYYNAHSHMQCAGGSRQVNSCGQGVTGGGGGTVVYAF